MKILVVEDELYSRKSLMKQIATLTGEKNVQVLEAANGQQGLELFLVESPELVFSDIRMPHMDGIELLRAIKSHDPTIQVIMISGYADFEYAQEAINIGASGYLLKPVHDQQLDAILQKALQASSLRYWMQEVGTSDPLGQYIASWLLGKGIEADFPNKTVFEKIFVPYRMLTVHFEKGSIQTQAFIEQLHRIQDSKTWNPFRIIQQSRNLWHIILKESETAAAFIHTMRRAFLSVSDKVNLGVSNIHQNLETIRQSALESDIAAKSKLFYSSPILYYNQTEKKTIPYYNLNQLDVLKLYLERGDSTKSLSMVKNWLKDMQLQKHFSTIALQLFLDELDSLFREVLLSDSLGEASPPLLPAFNLFDYNQLQDVISEVKRKTIAVCQLVQKQTSLQQDNTVEYVLDSIEKNYNSDISLSTLAEEVLYLNTTYLSNLIKEKTGHTYSYHLLQTRMQHAKEHLMHTDLPITEIALLVGYSNSSQFIKVFREQFGMTPKKFRDTYLPNKDRKKG